MGYKPQRQIVWDKGLQVIRQRGARPKGLANLSEVCQQRPLSFRRIEWLIETGVGGWGDKRNSSFEVTFQEPGREKVPHGVVGLLVPSNRAEFDVFFRRFWVCRAREAGIIDFDILRADDLPVLVLLSPQQIPRPLIFISMMQSER